MDSLPEFHRFDRQSLNSLDRLRPLVSLTPQEKWRIFISRSEIKLAAFLVISAIVVGYFIGSHRNNEKPAFAKKVETSESYVTTTTAAKSQKIKVYVSGEVNAPGVYELESSARINDALQLAGGITGSADLSKCNLAAFALDGSSINVPAKAVANTNSCGGMVSSTQSSLSESSPSNQQMNATGKVNLNTATQSEIETLPGVGPTLGAAIISYRTQHGSFASINDLKKVKGIGEKRFSDLKDLIAI